MHPTFTKHNFLNIVRFSVRIKKLRDRTDGSAPNLRS